MVQVVSELKSHTECTFHATMENMCLCACVYVRMHVVIYACACAYKSTDYHSLNQITLQFS